MKPTTSACIHLGLDAVAWRRIRRHVVSGPLVMRDGIGPWAGGRDHYLVTLKNEWGAFGPLRGVGASSFSNPSVINLLVPSRE